MRGLWVIPQAEGEFGGVGMAWRFVSILDLPARAWLLGSAAAFVLAAPHPVLANQRPVLAAEAGGRQAFKSVTLSFDIPAGTLEAALQKWSDISNLEVLAATQQVNGLKTAGLSGVFTPEQALKKLLIASTLKYELTSPNSIAVYDPASAHGARAQATVTLPHITVRTPRRKPAPRPVPPAPAPVTTAVNPNSTMTLPPAYAGGQVATGGQLGLLGNRGIMDTPFSQASYTSKLMQDQNARTLDDVVANDPAVRKQSSPGNGVEDFGIRGLEVSGRDFMFNGLPAVAPTNGGAMMVESLERVEVLKGPNAILNGIALAAAAGGAVNLIPKRATDTPISQLNVDYGTRSQLGTHVDVGRRFGVNKEFGARFNGVYRDGKTAIDNQTRQQGLAALGLDYRGDIIRAAADIGYQHDDLDGVRRGVRLTAGLPVPTPPSNRTNYNNPFEYQKVRTLYGTFKGEVDVARNVTAFATFGGSQNLQDFTTANLTSNNTNGNIAATTVRNQAYIFNGLSGNAGFRSTFDTGPVKHNAIIAYAQTVREWKIHQGPLRNLVASNFYNPIYTSTAPISADFDQAKKNQDLNFTSYVFADTLSVLDERVQLTVGARQQNAELTRYNITSGATTASYDKSALTPMAAILVKPMSNVALYANYIEALQEGGSAPLTAANAGESLPPFVAKQREIGAKWDLGRFTTTLAWFEITQPSASTNPTTNIYALDGEQRNRGIEWSVFGEVTRGVRLLGGMTYVDAILTQTTDGQNVGNHPTGVSPYHFVMGTELDVPFVRGLTLMGRVTHDSSNYLNLANTQKVPGWTRWDAGARYAFVRADGKPVVVRGTVTNITNASYWQNSGTQLGLSEPLTVRLSSSFDF
jgi:iron complex outermembrane recepter protein